MTTLLIDVLKSVETQEIKQDWLFLLKNNGVTEQQIKTMSLQNAIDILALSIQTNLDIIASKDPKTANKIIEQLEAKLCQKKQ